MLRKRFPPRFLQRVERANDLWAAQLMNCSERKTRNLQLLERGQMGERRGTQLPHVRVTQIPKNGRSTHIFHARAQVK